VFEPAEDALANGKNKVVMSTAMIVQIIDLYNRGVFLEMVQGMHPEREEKVMYHKDAADFLDPKRVKKKDTSSGSPTSDSESESDKSTSGRVCAGTKKDGTPCTLAPRKGTEYCRHHGKQ